MHDKEGVLVAAPNSPEEQSALLSRLRAAELALSDPLKAETRKARLYLLGVSMVGITIVRTGLVPQEITTLGITFGEADRRSLLVLLALVILYFLVAFAVYGLSDFLAWRHAYADAHWAAVRTEAKRKAEEQSRRKEEFPRAVDAAHEAVDEAERKAQEAESRAQEAQRELDEALGKQAEEDGPEDTTLLLGKVARLRQEAREAKVAAGVIAGMERGLADYARNIVYALDSSRQLDFEDFEEVIESFGPGAWEAMKSANEWARRVGISLPFISLAEDLVARRQERLVTRAIGRYSALSPTVSWVRALFEFLLPVVVGIYAIYALLSA